MTSLSHEPARPVREGWTKAVVVETWASIAISVIWLAVVVAAIWGPDIVSDTPGGTHSSVPSAVVLAPFAFLATWVVARYGFRGRD